MLLCHLWFDRNIQSTTAARPWSSLFQLQCVRNRHIAVCLHTLHYFKDHQREIPKPDNPLNPALLFKLWYMLFPWPPSKVLYWRMDDWPFIRVEVTAYGGQGEEGRRTVSGAEVLKEARNIETKVPRSGQVVWVRVHPPDDLEETKSQLGTRGSRPGSKQQPQEREFLCLSRRGRGRK